MIIEADDLVSAADVARIFGVTKQTVSHWLHRGDSGFPGAVVVVNDGVTPLYLRSEVLMWHEARPAHSRTWAHRTRDLTTT